jgi:hypothetical protein
MPVFAGFPLIFNTELKETMDKGKTGCFEGASTTVQGVY